MLLTKKVINAKILNKTKKQENGKAILSVRKRNEYFINLQFTFIQLGKIS